MKRHHFLTIVSFAAIVLIASCDLFTVEPEYLLEGDPEFPANWPVLGLPFPEESQRAVLFGPLFEENTAKEHMAVLEIGHNGIDSSKVGILDREAIRKMQEPEKIERSEEEMADQKEYNFEEVDEAEQKIEPVVMEIVWATAFHNNMSVEEVTAYTEAVLAETDYKDGGMKGDQHRYISNDGQRMFILRWHFENEGHYMWIVDELKEGNYNDRAEFKNLEKL